MREDDVKEKSITALRQKLAALEAENILLRAAVEANNALVSFCIKQKEKGNG